MISSEIGISSAIPVAPAPSRKQNYAVLPPNPRDLRAWTVDREVEELLAASLGRSEERGDGGETVGRRPAAAAIANSRLLEIFRPFKCNGRPPSPLEKDRVGGIDIAALESCPRVWPTRLLLWKNKSGSDEGLFVRFASARTTRRNGRRWARLSPCQRRRIRGGSWLVEVRSGGEF
ncbi:hypothetical protein KM043_001418 [Ampulex compressa]|nr:hypothetical protein KM043_001418 [Ampulex compressa]